MARPRAIPADAVPWIPDASAPPTRDARGEPLIRLQTLGAAVIQCGEARVGPSAGILFALLLRLTHAPSMRVPRDVLLAALWPEQKDERRRASLRQALYKLRGLGVRVGLDGEVVQFDPAQLVRTFASERTTARFERDVTTGHEPFGPFLPGYVAPTAPFEEWVGIEREAVHADVRHVLVTQLRARRERADWSSAEALARWLLRFDPLHEDATLMLAECTMLAGAKAEAIAILDRYLAELGPNAGDIRLPALQMRRRFVEATRGRISFAPTERHFVGREDEITAFTLAMRRARWRDGSAVLLHGPSGMGKTRLTLEVGKVAIVEGLREVRASCCESDRHRVLSVIFDMLPELIEQPGALGCEPESLATLRRLVPDSRMRTPEAATFRASDLTNDSTDPTLGGGIEATTGSTAKDDFEGVGATNYSAPHEVRVIGDVLEPSYESILAREPLPMQSSIRRAVVELVAAVSDERPMLLVVDNVHWIDAASWDVLADIVERISQLRLVVMLTSRTPHACVVRPERTPVSLLVRELLPLKAESSSSLARLIGEDLSAPMSDANCDWFVDACEGSPLFLRSLVNHWIETGEAGGLPPTLQQVIEARLSKLGPDALQTLQAIAMLDKFAGVDRVQRVLESSTSQSLESLEELASAGAFRESSTKELQCHELLGRAAIGTLGGPAKKMLHLKIASVLASDGIDPSQSLSLAVLEHLSAAGEWARLSMFAGRRGTELLQSGYPARALAVCEAARRELPAEFDDQHLGRVELEALYLAGRYSRLIDVMSKSPTDFSVDSGWDAAHPVDVLNFIESARHADSAASYEDLCARAVMLAESEAVSESVRLRAATTGIKLAGHGMRHVLPLRAYHAGSKIAARMQDRLAEQALLDMYFHTSFGDQELALAAARNLRANYIHTRNCRDQLYLGSDIGYALRVTGAMDEARDQFASVYSIGAREGVVASAGVAAWYLSMIAMDIDADVEEATRWIMKCRDLPGAVDEELLRLLVAQQQARLAIVEKRLDLAIEHRDAAKRCFVKAPQPKRLAYGTAIDLAIALLADDMDQIAALCPEAESRFESLKSTLGQDYLATQVIAAQARLGRKDDANATFADYVSACRRERSPIPRYLAAAAPG